MLRIDDGNIKAMYRLGQANVGLKDYDKAMKALKEALVVSPEDKGKPATVSWNLHLVLDCFWTSWNWSNYMNSFYHIKI